MKKVILFLLTFVLAGVDANAGPCNMNEWDADRECDCTNVPTGTSNKHVYFNFGMVKAVGIGADGKLFIKGVVEGSNHEVQFFAPANLPIDTTLACFQNAKELVKNVSLNMAVDATVSTNGNWGGVCQVQAQSISGFGCELTKDHNAW